MATEREVSSPPDIITSTVIFSNLVVVATNSHSFMLTDAILRTIFTTHGWDNYRRLSAHTRDWLRLTLAKAILIIGQAELLKTTYWTYKEFFAAHQELLDSHDYKFTQHYHLFGDYPEKDILSIAVSPAVNCDITILQIMYAGVLMFDGTMQRMKETMGQFGLQ